jgi:uncharacterized membrane protein
MNLLKSHQTAVLLTLFCLFKLTARAIFFGNLHLFFLVWNLFLAIIPYVVSSYMVKNIKHIKNKSVIIVVFWIWILFLPNAFYVLTDIIHIRLSTSKTLILDVLTIFSFAITAWWFGLASIKHFQLIMVNHYHKKWFGIYDYILPFMMALGVYMGRFDRYNTWDILTQPHEIFFTAFKHITNIQILVICLFYGLVIHITMYTLKNRSPSPDGSGSP